MILRIRLCLVVAAGGLSALVTNAADNAGLFADPVLVRGKGIEIKQSQLDDAFVAFRANLAARGQNVPENQRLEREAQLLDRLIVTQLLVNRAVDADKSKAAELSEKVLAQSKKSAASEEMFNLQLKALGLGVEEFKRRVLEQALAEVVLEREVKSKLTVTDAQVQDFYTTGTDVLVKSLQGELERLAKDPATTADQLAEVKKRIDEVKKSNLSRLDQPEKVRVSHILISTRVRDREEQLPEDQKKIKRLEAEKLLARARKDEDFTNLIVRYSEDRGVKESKGEYTFSRDDRFVPEFKAASFSLQPGQISDLVTTIFGYHIIKLHEKIPAKKTDLAKAAPDIKELLRQQELQKQMPDYFDRLKKELGVEILDPKYRIALPKETDPIKPPG